MVHGFPKGLFARGCLPGWRSPGPRGFVINLVLGYSRLQGCQSLQLQSAEAVLAQVSDHLGQFGSRSQGALSGPRGARPGWSFLVGDHLPAVVDHELSVALLQDFYLDTCKARPFLVREQLQGAPLVLDRVVPGHLTQVVNNGR